MLRLLHTALKAFPPSADQGDTLPDIARRMGVSVPAMRSHADSLCHLGLVAMRPWGNGVPHWFRTEAGDEERNAPPANDIATALLHVVEAVNAMGGVVTYTDGDHAPASSVADTMMGAAYMEACRALSIRPMVKPPAPAVDAGGGKALAPTTWPEPCGCVGHLRDDGSTYADPMCATHAAASEHVG